MLFTHRDLPSILEQPGPPFNQIRRGAKSVIITFNFKTVLGPSTSRCDDAVFYSRLVSDKADTRLMHTEEEGRKKNGKLARRRSCNKEIMKRFLILPYAISLIKRTNERKK